MDARTSQVRAASDRPGKTSLRPKNTWLLFFATMAWLFGPTVMRVNAQLNYLTVTGHPDPASTIPVENGYVDSATGNLHLEVPLGSFPQRGLPTLTGKLIYDSRIWQIVNGVWQPTNVANSQGGWRFIMTGGPGSVSYSTYPWNDGQGHYGNTYAYFTWTAPDSTIHSFSFKTWSAVVGTPSPNGDSVATDSSGFHMWVTSYTSAVIYAPDGTQVYPYNIDSNGNYLSTDVNGYITADTVNRAPVTKRTCAPNTCYDVQNSQSTGNGVSTYTVATATIHVKTNFGQATDCTTSCTITVIQSIQLPDSSTYSFQYDCDKTVDPTDCSSPSNQSAYYGTLASMTPPTGATVTYQFTNFSDAYGNHNMWLNTRKISGTGITAGTWTYTPQVNTTCTSGGFNCHQQLNVTAPSTDTKVYMFNLNGGAHAYEIDSNTGSSTLLASVTQSFDYSQSCPPFALCVGPGAAFVSMTASTTTLPIPNSTNISKTTKYTWDTTTNYGNVMITQEWNYYTGTLPTSADRTTTVAYLNTTPYINANILNRPSSVTVANKSGATVAQTLYSYDGSATDPATNMANHNDTYYGTSDTVRGNLTQVQRLVSGSTYLTTSMTYDMTGQVKTSTDFNRNTTQFDYTDNFYTDPGDGQNPTVKSVTPSTNAYIKTITYPTVYSGTFTKTIGYYWGTGQVALSTDENSNTSYLHFNDPLNRPTSTALPNSEWTRFTYNSTETQVDAYTGTTNSTASTSCTVCRHDQTILNSIGRVSSNSLVNDPDGKTYVNTTYDSNGRVATVSNPYRSMSDPTYGLETPSYDGLDRTTQVKHADSNSVNICYGAVLSTGCGSTWQACSSSTYGIGYPAATRDEAGHYRQTWTALGG